MTYQYSNISLSEMPGQICLCLYSPGCNLTCPWCFNPSLRNGKPLTFKQAKDAIDEHEDFIQSVCISGGEPLLNPHLKKIIKYIKDKGLNIKLNTNGLIPKSCEDNWHLGYLDYINVSLKGDFQTYNTILKEEPYSILHNNAETLEYSFVYIDEIHTKTQLLKFSKFLNKKIVNEWWSFLSDDKWSKPDIFTISQFQPKDCLCPKYNEFNSPSEAKCIEVAKLFKDIPKKELIVETRENGRVIINKR